MLSWGRFKKKILCAMGKLQVEIQLSEKIISENVNQDHNIVTTSSILSMFKKKAVPFHTFLDNHTALI